MHSASDFSPFIESGSIVRKTGDDQRYEVVGGRVLDIPAILKSKGPVRIIKNLNTQVHEHVLEAEIYPC